MFYCFILSTHISVNPPPCGWPCKISSYYECWMARSVWIIVNKSKDLILCCLSANENNENNNITLIKYFLSLSNHPQVGLCVAARPHPVFASKHFLSWCTLPSVKSVLEWWRQKERLWHVRLQSGVSSRLVNTLNCLHAHVRPYARGREAMVRIPFRLLIVSSLTFIHTEGMW